MRLFYLLTLLAGPTSLLAATPAQLREMQIITKCGMVAGVIAVVYQNRNNAALVKQDLSALAQRLKTIEPIEPNIDELAIRTALRMVDSLDSSYAPNPVPKDVLLTGASAMCALELSKRTDDSSGVAKDFYRSK